MATKNVNKGDVVAEYGVGSGWSGRGSLADLAAELQLQADAKHDVVVDPRALEIHVGPDRQPRLFAGDLAPAAYSEFIPANGLALTKNAIEQIGARVSPTIAGKTATSLYQQRPEEFAALFTSLMQKTRSETTRGGNRMMRCLGDTCRAWLSDQYLIMDHYDLVRFGLKSASEHNARVLEGSLTEDRMRLKLVSYDVWDAIETVRTGSDRASWYAGGLGSQAYLSKVAATSRGRLPGQLDGDPDIDPAAGPDTVWPVVTITNSETGQGGLNIRLGVLVAACYNLATVEVAVNQIHLGERLDTGIYSESTVRKSEAAIMGKVADAIAAAFTPDRFAALCAGLRDAAADPIENPASAVRNVVSAARLPDALADKCLEHFLGDYRATRWGLSQAVTRAAQDIDDPDAAEELISLGGTIATDAKKAAVLIG